MSAAAGGVGSLVVQLLARLGVNVLGLASAANESWLRTHGVTRIDYRDRIAERLTAIAPGGIDAFIDLFGPDYVQLAVDLGIRRDRIETTIAFDKAAELGTKADGSVTASTTDVLTEIAGLATTGELELPIAASYPLDRVQDAFAQLEQRHTHGKIVLTP